MSDTKIDNEIKIGSQTDTCGCGHIRHAHTDAGCKDCPCTMFTILLTEELFPEFWAGFGKRMEAAGDSPEVIARTTWHAAKAGNAASDQWQRKYHEMERAHSLGIDRNGELLGVIQDREADRSREQDLKNGFRARLEAAEAALMDCTAALAKARGDGRKVKP